MRMRTWARKKRSMQHYRLSSCDSIDNGDQSSTGLKQKFIKPRHRATFVSTSSLGRYFVYVSRLFKHLPDPDKDAHPNCRWDC